MNKKFFGGVVFGLVLGVGIGVSSPIIGATDIIINNKKPAQTSATNITTNTSESDSSREMVSILKEINETIKRNGDQEARQNEKLITGINTLIQRTGFVPPEQSTTGIK